MAEHIPFDYSGKRVLVVGMARSGVDASRLLLALGAVPLLYDKKDAQALGAQYGWNDMVFARAGFHLGTGKAPLPTYASVGLGVKFVGVHLDVSYLLASKVLGNTLCVGIGYAF